MSPGTPGQASPTDTRVAIVGTGMIGCSWAVAFARGGCEVALYDSTAGAAEQALKRLHGQLAELASLQLLGGNDADSVGRRLRVALTLDGALEGATHVQEYAPESNEVKQRLFGDLIAGASSTASLASSSSALLPSAFLPENDAAARCLVAHPLIPPHLVPAVELVPGRTPSRPCSRKSPR